MLRGLPDGRSVCNGTEKGMDSSASMSGSALLSADEKRMIVRSYRLIEPISETVGDLFYRRLFEMHPQYRPLFPDDMTRQKQKLMTMLAFIAKCLDWTEEQWRQNIKPDDDLFLVVLALGRRHHALYKIPDDAYGPVVASLLWALEQGLGQAYTKEVGRAWSKLCNVVATSMQLGAKSSRIKMEFGQVA
jgi:hemoglobin-like flavoprotein